MGTLRKLQIGALGKDALDLDEPVAFADLTEVTALLKKPKMMVALANFGGSYKRQNGFKEEGRAQTPFYKNEGKEEADELSAFLANLIGEDHKVPPDDVPAGCKSVTQVTWIYGYNNDMSHLAYNPNGLAQFKLLVAGEARWISSRLHPSSQHLRRFTGQISR
jgi:hypothetical protein